MLNVKHFRDLIIVPTLKMVGLESPSATVLLLGTAIQESTLTHLTQLDGDDDPYDDAVGLYQMEVKTHDDIWENYLNYRPQLADAVQGLTAFPPTAREMVGNLWYATAMCRVHYRRVPEALPDPGDIEGMADYWKAHYNTFEGAGTGEEFIENWNEATFGM